MENGEGFGGRAATANPPGEDRRNYSGGLVSAIDRTADPIELLMPAVAAGSDDLRDTVACGIFWLRDLAEEMPEGERREALEQLIGRLERNIERELDELPLAIAEAFERELATDLIIRGGRA